MNMQQFEPRVNQEVDLGKWGKGPISEIHRCRDTNRVMVVTIKVKPKSKLDKMFADKDGLIVERASFDEVEWIGDSWRITERAVKDRKWSDAHGGV